MPSKSERQRRFFGAVMSCKEGGKCGSPEIRRAAESMTYNQIRDYLKKRKKKK